MEHELAFAIGRGDQFEPDAGYFFLYPSRQKNPLPAEPGPAWGAAAGAAVR
jgi:hypothetical protein